MAQHNELGKWGESIAAKFLEEKGYHIVARDWKDNHKDIDIVAIDTDTLVFVEVKTRRNDYFLQPEQAVNGKKIKNITLAANKFVKMHQIDLQIRFDIISIVGTDESNCKINHIEDAFLPYYFR
jgi:putative endonuclease